MPVAASVALDQGKARSLATPALRVDTTNSNGTSLAERALRRQQNSSHLYTRARPLPPRHLLEHIHPVTATPPQSPLSVTAAFLSPPRPTCTPTDATAVSPRGLFQPMFRVTTHPLPSSPPPPDHLINTRWGGGGEAPTAPPSIGLAPFPPEPPHPPPSANACTPLRRASTTAGNGRWRSHPATAAGDTGARRTSFSTLIAIPRSRAYASAPSHPPAAWATCPLPPPTPATLGATVATAATAPGACGSLGVDAASERVALDGTRRADHRRPP